MFVVMLTDILGNAYISLFFTCGQNPQMSQQALSAYAQSVSTEHIELRSLFPKQFLLHVLVSTEVPTLSFLSFRRKWTEQLPPTLTCTSTELRSVTHLCFCKNSCI